MFFIYVVAMATNVGFDPMNVRIGFVVHPGCMATLRYYHKGDLV